MEKERRRETVYKRQPISPAALLVYLNNAQRGGARAWKWMNYKAPKSATRKVARSSASRSCDNGGNPPVTCSQHTPLFGGRLRFSAFTKRSEKRAVPKRRLPGSLTLDSATPSPARFLTLLSHIYFPHLKRRRVRSVSFASEKKR